MPKENSLNCFPEFSGIFRIHKDDTNVKFAKCLLKYEDAACDADIKLDIGGYAKKYNLWRHLKRQHINEFNRLKKKMQEDEKVIALQKVQPTTTVKQTSLSSFFRPSRISIKMDAVTFKAGIVKMVCSGSVPLTVFSGEGFQLINAELAKQLGVTLGHEAIRNLVISTAQQARFELKKTLCGKLLFLKMDAATRGTRNFLALNAQYYDHEINNICVKTLDIIDTEHTHGSEFIKCKVKEILNRFEIDASQILSICVDNAANMVRAVKTFSELELLNDCESDDDDWQVHVYDEYDLTREWVDNPEVIIPSWVHQADSPVQLMRCGIHTLQLAVWTGLNTELSKRQMCKIRNAVTKLRTPTIRAMLKKKFGCTQSVDTVTRWGSTFLMIKRLLKFQNFCEEAVATGAKELELDWDVVHYMYNLLKEPYAATILLQSESLTPGLFFKEWCRVKSFLNGKSEVIATSMLTAMKKRESNLFNNTHFLGAVFIDSRYRILLTEDQVKLAKSGLFDIALRLKKICSLRNVHTAAEVDNNTSTSTTTSEEDEFERELDMIEKRKKVSPSQSSIENFKIGIYDSLLEVEKKGRIKIGNVFEIIKTYPANIQSACQIASSMPTTQVSVERLFSSLKIIVSDLRQSIKEDLISSILFIRQNNVV